MSACTADETPAPRKAENRKPSLLRLGIDTGGAFTDLVFLGAGEGRVYKVPSTPDHPWRAILAGIKELRPEGLEGLAGGHRY
ncbi:MAG: hypothetical protein NTW80_09240 [Deltaproteobacteria bacterium]|nr:hypothetical protein [Deltaproteobacteria bacterium]